MNQDFFGPQPSTVDATEPTRYGHFTPTPNVVPLAEAMGGAPTMDNRDYGSVRGERRDMDTIDGPINVDTAPLPAYTPPGTRNRAVASDVDEVSFPFVPSTEPYGPINPAERNRAVRAPGEASLEFGGTPPPPPPHTITGPYPNQISDQMSYRLPLAATNGPDTTPDMPYDSDQGPHEAADNTSSALWPEAEAALPQPPGFLDRAKSNLNILGGQVSGFLNDYSLPSAIRDAAEQQQLEREARAGADPTDVAAMVIPNTPTEQAWRQANPDKAARLDELRADQMALAAGASGTMGGGGMAEDAISAIKGLRAAGFEESAAQAMRELSQKSALTLDEIRARVTSVPAAVPEVPKPSGEPLPNEVPNPFPLTDEERALNAAADERATTPGAPDVSDPGEAPRINADDMPVTGQAVERAYRPELPGMEDVARPAPEEHIPGQGNVVDQTPEAASRQLQERTRYETEDPATRPVTWEQTAEQAQGVDTAAVRERVLNQEPGLPAAESHALRTEAAGINEAWAQAQRELQAFKAEHTEPGKSFDPSKLNRDEQEQAAHLITRLENLDRQVNPANTASNRMSTEIARAFTQLRSAISGSRALDQVKRMGAFYDQVKGVGQALQEAVDKGVLTPPARQKLERLRDSLRNPKERITGPSEAVQGELDAITEAAQTAKEKAGGGTRPPTTPTAPPTSTPEESFAEKLGRLKREQGRLEDTNGPPAELERVRGEITDTLNQIRLDAQERARNWMEKRGQKPNLNDLPEAERERIINESAGRSTVQRIRAAARTEASGTAAAKEQEDWTRRFQAAVEKQMNDEKKLQSSIDQSFQRRIDSALAKERRADVRTQVQNMANDAKDIQTAIRARPNDQDLRTWMDLHLRQMSEHSTLGETVSNQLRDRFEREYGKDANSLLAGVEKRNAAADAKKLRDLQRSAEDQKLSMLADQIDFVLKHQNAPDAMQRYAELAADMTAVSQRGFEKSRQLREQLWKQNLTRAGMNVKGIDLKPMVATIAKMDPSDPASIKAALDTLRNPSWGGAYHELQFIHMLSDPRTHVRNIQSNVLNGSLRLFVQNPVEAIAGGLMGAKDTGGALAAFRGVGRGFVEELPNAWAVWRHGVNPRMVEEAVDSMNIARMGREQITDKLGQRFGKPGEAFGTALHMISTRPLESMDTLLGHMMYASKVDQEVARTANRFASEGHPDFAGMNKGQIADHIRNNLWQYPQIVDQAEYVRNYTLLRAKDQGLAERKLRDFMTGREVGPNSPALDRIASAVLDFAVPFFNVPLNFTKQGIERSVGAPVYLGKAAVEAARGHPREAAEALGKSTVGMGILGFGGLLAATDNLTFDGPTDPGRREVWLIDHQPRSFRMPGFNTWIGWENTPVAIPWAAIAGAKEAMEQADFQGGKQGWTDANRIGKGLVGGAQGAMTGALSNTFLEGVQQNFDALTLQQSGPSAIASTLANTAARYNPVPLPSGFLGFLARVADGTDRDVGRIKDYSPEVIGGNAQARLEARVPVLRNTLPERRNAFGEVVPNPTGGNVLRAISPFRVGYGQGAGDVSQNEKAQKLEGVGVGMPNAPAEIAVHGHGVPLNQDEQRQFQTNWGQYYSHNLDLLKQKYPDRVFPDEVYTRARDAARERAQQDVMRSMGREEFLRRLKDQMSREAHPVR
jgi:hypothetical protein